MKTVRARACRWLATRCRDCDDGDFCTVDDRCVLSDDGVSAVCTGDARDCSEEDVPPCITGVCDEEAGACVARINEDEPCDDGDDCTEGETCQADGSCGGGTDVCGPDECATSTDCPGPNQCCCAQQGHGRPNRCVGANGCTGSNDAGDPDCCRGQNSKRHRGPGGYLPGVNRDSGLLEEGAPRGPLCLSPSWHCPPLPAQSP